MRVVAASASVAPLAILTGVHLLASASHKTSVDRQNDSDLFYVSRTSNSTRKQRGPVLSKAERRRRRNQNRATKRERQRGFRSNSAKEDAHWIEVLSKAQPDEELFGTLYVGLVAHASQRRSPAGVADLSS